MIVEYRNICKSYSKAELFRHSESSKNLRPSSVIHQTAILPLFLLSTKPRLSRSLSRLFSPLLFRETFSDISAVHNTGSDESKNAASISPSLTRSGLPGTVGYRRTAVKNYQRTFISTSVGNKPNLTFNSNVYDNGANGKSRGLSTLDLGPLRNCADPELWARVRVGSREPGTASMSYETTRRYENIVRTSQAKAEKQFCPTCYTEVAGVTTKGPGTRVVEPCGCEVRGRLLDEKPPVAADGGCEWVWVSGRRNGGSREAYHTDKTCRALGWSESPPSRVRLEDVQDLGECNICEGNIDYNGPDAPHEMRRKLGQDLDADSVTAETAGDSL